MKILSGSQLANSIVEELKKQVLALAVSPNLAVIVVGSNPVIDQYVARKSKTAQSIGAKVKVYKFPQKTTDQKIISKIDELNNNSKIDGIIVQLPVPKFLNLSKIVWSIKPSKDVDGFQMREFRPPAPLGILDLLSHYKITIFKKKITLVGFGILVGKPLSVLLKKQGAIISICDSQTFDLREKVKSADIVISAVGKPNLITADMVSPASYIIDAGTSSEGGTVVGDVDFESIKNKVAGVSPVPGGIGPLTVANLLRNLVKAANKQNESKLQIPLDKLLGYKNGLLGPFIKKRK